MTWKVGDRVSWMGGLNFGRDTVRWVGRITKLGLGVPNGKYERRNVGLEDEYLAEVGSRDPAAEVEPDYPQHGVKEHLVHQVSIVVRLADLTKEG